MGPGVSLPVKAETRNSPMFAPAAPKENKAAPTETAVDTAVTITPAEAKTNPPTVSPAPIPIITSLKTSKGALPS